MTKKKPTTRQILKRKEEMLADVKFLLKQGLKAQRLYTKAQKEIRTFHNIYRYIELRFPELKKMLRDIKKENRKMSQTRKSVL